jgi:hypothetical protein
VKVESGEVVTVGRLLHGMHFTARRVLDVMMQPGTAAIDHRAGTTQKE